MKTTKTLKTIIEDYIKKLKKLNHKDLIINMDWMHCDENLNVIYCGDNPGKTEAKEKRYFVGNAGKELDKFIKVNNKFLGVNNFTFFNKTPYYSNRTNQLSRVSDSDGVILKSIQLTVKCIYEIWELKRIPIIIFGVNKSAYIVYEFFKELKKVDDNEFKNSITILNHPSNNSLFGMFGNKLIEKFDKEGFDLKISYFELLKKCSRNDLLS